MMYRTCPYCGANLDAGENCDCREAEGQEEMAEEDAGAGREPYDGRHLSIL